jgi:hypothetical protein
MHYVTVPPPALLGARENLIQDGQRFIPVVIDDVELPGFAATRYYADFRHVSGEEYELLIGKITEALRGRKLTA